MKKTTPNSNSITYAAFIAVVLGFFMAQLDLTVVNITLPVLVDYFKTDVKTISWVVNGFNLAFAVLLITAARLGDQFGRKKLFLTGIALFILSSFLSGISHSVNQLIFFRVLQGISAAFIIPISMPLILRLFPPSMAGTVIGIWGAVAGIAAASGPALGGIITNYFNWQWIFFINIPIGFITIALTARLIDESFDPTASKHIDWPGLVTLTTGMFCLVLALIKANEKGWTSPYILTLFGTAAAGLAAFYFVETRTQEPMLPMGLLRNRFFFISCIELFIIGAGLMLGVFFMAFFLVQIMEMSQLQAGLTVTAFPLAAMVSSAVSGRFSDRYGSRWFIVSGMVLVCISGYMFSKLNPMSGMKYILECLMVSGFGMGLALPSVIGASIRAIPADKIGMGSGVGNMVRALGAALGVALLVSSLTHFANKSIPNAVAETAAIISADTVLRAEAKEAFLNQLHSVKFTQESKLPTKEQVVRRFNERKAKELEGKTGLRAAMIETVYKGQVREVEKMYPAVKMVFKKRIAWAFDRTFVLAGIALLSGIVFGLYCEPVRKRKL